MNSQAILVITLLLFALEVVGGDDVPIYQGYEQYFLSCRLRRISSVPHPPVANLATLSSQTDEDNTPIVPLPIGSIPSEFSGSPTPEFQIPATKTHSVLALASAAEDTTRSEGCPAGLQAARRLPRLHRENTPPWWNQNQRRRG